MDIYVNLLLRTTTDANQNIVRVLWYNEELVYVINIYKNKLPYIILRSQIELEFEKGYIEFVDEDPFILGLYKEEDISDKYKEMRDRSWYTIKEFATQEPLIFESKYRSKKIKEAAVKSGLSELSVLGYLKRYWIRSKNPNALLPDYFNCGLTIKDRKSGISKRGRPRSNPEVTGIGINITEEIRKIFILSINKFYYTTAKNSLILTYELMRKEYFSDGYEIINDVKIPNIKSQKEIPSFGQFRYWYDKERNIKKEITSRYSNKKFQKQYRSIPGNANDGITQPGTYEIDCQIGDLYLVSRYNRNQVVGRSVIYIVIDKYSKIICGLYVGYETGSYPGAMMALMNTFTSKIEFCSQYGIEIKEEDWPVHHIPNKIIADRGELEGTNINNLINTLNVEISLAPPYRADLKSAVERFHSILNSLIKPHLPGVIDLNGRERGDKDYRLTAKLDIYQFTRIVIKAVLYYNNNSILNNYKRDEFLIADDVPCIARDIFVWGIENRGKLRIAKDDVIKLALMPCDEATVTGKGMYYTSKYLLKEQILVNAREKTWKVKISYDPRNMNIIYLHGDKSGEYDKCHLIDVNGRYKDKMIEEIETLLSIEKMQKEKMKDSEAQAKTQLITEIEDIVKNAEDDYKRLDTTNESDRKRVKNIRGNREIEKVSNRLVESFELGREDEDLNESNFNRDSNNDNYLDLLFKRQMGDLYGDK